MSPWRRATWLSRLTVGALLIGGLSLWGAALIWATRFAVSMWGTR